MLIFACAHVNTHMVGGNTLFKGGNTHVVGGNTPLRYVLILTCWNHLELLSIFNLAVLIMEDNLNTSELQSLMMEE